MIPALLLSLLVPSADAAEISVLGTLKREARLAPGDRTEGTVLVRNDGTAPREVQVYLRDYAFQADGSNQYAEPGTLPRSNAAWVQVQPSAFTLGPGETAKVWYTVQPPADADLSGTYWSMLMVEPAPEGPGPKDPKRGVAVRTVIRYGVQLVSHVGDPGEGELAFVDASLGRVDDRTILHVDIANPGERLLAPRVWTEVYDEHGRSHGRFTAPNRSSLLPGCSSRFPLDLSGLPAGRYQAVIVADAGDAQVFGTEYVLDVTE